MSSVKRGRRTGRFESLLDPVARLRVIAEVARHVDADEPEAVSQRRWDSGRAPAGHPEAPSARQMCQALKLSWSEALRVALDESRNLTQTVAALSKADERTWSERELHYALHLVAREIERRSFTSNEYERARDVLIRRDRGRNGHQAILERLLPTRHQIIYSVGEKATWNDALASVGLDPFIQDRTQRKALSVGEAYDLFIELTNNAAAPTRTQLDYLRKRWGISVARISKMPGSWEEIEEQLRANRAARGLKTPRKRMTHQEVKALVVPEDVLETLPCVKGRERWPYEKCVVALAEYLRELPADAGPSEHHYQSVSVKRDCPSASTIIRKAPWGVMVDAARYLLMTGELIPLQTAKREAGKRPSRSS
jgi:hypothetical protein